MLLVEYSVLDKIKVINEGTAQAPKLRVRGKFQKCDEANNNGRVYPRRILESQVKALQDKISERSLVGALDHPSNDTIHLSQASHLITKLWVEKNGDVMGEAEILSTPNGKIVEALINDGVKIGISSRGLGTLSEGKDAKIVNEDFKLITFDLVSDPSTKGAFPELTESVKLNSEKAQKILSKYKKERIILTTLNEKIDSKLSEGDDKKFNKRVKNDQDAAEGEGAIKSGRVSTAKGSRYDTASQKGGSNAGLRAAGRLARQADSKPAQKPGRISHLNKMFKLFPKKEATEILYNSIVKLIEGKRTTMTTREKVRKLGYNPDQKFSHTAEDAEMAKKGQDKMGDIANDIIAKKKAKNAPKSENSSTALTPEELLFNKLSEMCGSKKKKIKKAKISEGL